MDTCHHESALRVRSLIERDRSTPALLRSALIGVPPHDRDAWIDAAFGLSDVPDDGPDLPRGCVPYLPCPVDVLLRMVEEAPVGSSDVFVDVGSGLGRAMTLVHLLTGAGGIGLEVQGELVGAARHLAKRLGVSRVSTVHGDAAKLVRRIEVGTVFFLYCPFSGDRLVEVLSALELIARTRMIRVCAASLPLPPCRWLTLTSGHPGDLAIYRSTIHSEPLQNALDAKRVDATRSPTCSGIATVI